MLHGAFDKYHGVERTEDVGDIIGGLRVVEPGAIHEEFVFITSGRQDQPFFPKARLRVADHAQAGGLPVIEIAANIDMPGTDEFQDEIHLHRAGLRGNGVGGFVGADMVF